MLQAAGQSAPEDPLATAEANLGTGVRHALQALGCQSPTGPAQMLQTLLAFLSAAHSCDPTHWAPPSPPTSKVGGQRSRVGAQAYLQKSAGNTGSAQPMRKGHAGKKAGVELGDAELRPSFKAVLGMLEVVLREAPACRTAMWPTTDQVITCIALWEKHNNDMLVSALPAATYISHKEY